MRKWIVKYYSLSSLASLDLMLDVGKDSLMFKKVKNYF